MSLRQLGQEGTSFLRAPSTDITSQHNQAGAAARSDELRIRSVLPSALRPTLRSSRLKNPSQCKFDTECGVQGQLPPPEQGEPRPSPTSRRLMSRGFGRATSMFVVTRAHPLDTRGQQHSPRQTHAFPELQTWRKLHGGGHKSRVVTGSHAGSKREGGASDARAKCGRKGFSMRVKAQFGLVENAAPAPQPP